MSIPDLEVLNSHVAKIFRIDDVTSGDPREWIARYRGQLYSEDTVAAYDQLAEAVQPYNITPLFRKEDDGRHIIYLAPAREVPKPSASAAVNIVLFVVTIFTMMMIGAEAPAETANSNPSLITIFREILSGWPYALAMMGILFTHEMGHYLTCRYYKIPATLPYFIPMFPRISPFGTLGAFIAMRGIPKNKRVLFDVGVAGPLAGLVIAIPVLLYGLSTSSLGPISAAGSGGGLLEGNSLIYLFSKYLVFGKFLPEPVSMNGLSPVVYWVKYFFSGYPIPYGGLDVQLNSIAWAGWGGLLVTALNLVPVGTLDGGHVLHGLFGDKAHKVFPIMIGALIVFSILPVVLTLSLASFNYGWLLWVMILFWLGNVRTTPLDDITELNPSRRALAIFVLILFVLLLTPIPFTGY